MLIRVPLVTVSVTSSISAIEVSQLQPKFVFYTWITNLQPAFISFGWCLAELAFKTCTARYKKLSLAEQKQQNPLQLCKTFFNNFFSLRRFAYWTTLTSSGDKEKSAWHCFITWRLPEENSGLSDIRQERQGATRNCEERVQHLQKVKDNMDITQVTQEATETPNITKPPFNPICRTRQAPYSHEILSRKYNSLYLDEDLCIMYLIYCILWIDILFNTENDM